MRVGDYTQIPIVECGDPMADLGTYHFILDPAMYRMGLTKSPQMWLRQAVAAKLDEIQRTRLEPEGMRFKILDGWRSRGIQNKLYAKCWNEIAVKHPEWGEDRLREDMKDFVARADDEQLIPPHSTGGAVDLTIVGEGDATLDMGCEPFTWTREHPTCPTKTGPEAVICENLRRLVIVMQEAGFVQDPDQWWHFDYGNQKWAKITGAGAAIFGEMTGGAMGFMKKEWAYGHGMLLPFEKRNPS